MTRRSCRLHCAMAMGQGAFYLAAGLWPLVHLRSFERVTGPKPEGWLVKTVGLLLANLGGALLWGGLKKSVPDQLKVLAVSSAATLAAVDLVYAGKRRVSPVYLLDAAAEVGLLAGWALAEVADHRALTRAPLFAAAALAAEAA